MDASQVIDELNDHGFEDTTSTRKVAILNDTVADVCSREHWPFLEKELVLTFDGSSAVPSNFPADFSKLVGLTDPSTGNRIKWERWEVLRAYFANALDASGTPEYYYFVKNQLKTYPTPGSGQTLDLSYICWHPEVLEATVEADILIPARHHRVLVVGTLYKLYAMEDDPELSAVFKDEYERRIGMMREDLMRVQYDRPDRIFALDDDPFDSYYM